MKKYAPLFLLTTAAFGAQKCDPIPPAPCHEENCQTCHCLSPAQTIANAPVYPRTCNGDFVMEVAGLYWKAEQDGMEYAINNSGAGIFAVNLAALRNLIDATYQTPDFKWDFGFKLGFGYRTSCDGWDIGVTWISFEGKSSSHNEAELDDNYRLLPIWSAFVRGNNELLFATDIQSRWGFDLNLIDVALGRKFWLSKYLAFRPHIGVRFSSIKQKFNLIHRGGAWSLISPAVGGIKKANDYVTIDNNFKGTGLRSGIDMDWHLGCGFALYSNLAASIVYGRFDIDHDECIREASQVLAKTKILESENHFHCSRAMLDLALGIEWETLFCDCKYGFTVSLGWEQHLFFHQNQMWRVRRILYGINSDNFPNNTGDNVFSQRRGTLSTQGWTLSLRFEF